MSDNVDDSLVQLQTRIAELMSREVALSREILATMYEEEGALLAHDDPALQQIMSKRDLPLQELMKIREERIDSVKQLSQTIIQKDGGNGQLVGASEELRASALIDAAGEQSCEVLVLCDQLIALIQKMNAQNTSNNQLISHHHDYANLLNAHLDSWGYSLAHSKKPRVHERRKAMGLIVINEEPQ
jgi:hypothetical protein